MNNENLWTSYSEKEKQEIEKISKEYKEFLDKGKTEREVVENTVAILKENGYIFSNFLKKGTIFSSNSSSSISTEKSKSSENLCPLYTNRIAVPPLKKISLENVSSYNSLRKESCTNSLTITTSDI